MITGAIAPYVTTVALVNDKPVILLHNLIVYTFFFDNAVSVVTTPLESVITSVTKIFEPALLPLLKKSRIAALI